MAHPPEWHAERRKGLGGSDAVVVMGGDKEKLMKLWAEKRGIAEPEDLSWVLPVQVGVTTEDLNARWFEHHTGIPVTDAQKMFVSAEHPFMRCTIDGMAGDALYEAKHLSAFTKKDEPPIKYYAQLQHNMLVTGAQKAFLSVFFGTFDWMKYEVDACPLYQAQLVAAERAFWACVESGDPPAVINIPAPVEPVRRVDMQSSNAWAEHAAKFIENRDYAKAFDTAVKALKELTPADAIEAFGHGVTIKRNKAGSLSISESK